MLKPYIILMRVHHYIKNLLIFAALVFSGQFFVWSKFLSGVIGFCSFSLLTSAVYIINDIRDKEKDSVHLMKCKRPIASGRISIKNAVVLSVLLFFLSILCNMKVFHVSSSFLLLLYFVLNFAYSFGMKNFPIIDISILVAGFMIRTMYGAIITDIGVSNWLYLTVMAAAFYFALGKRRNELKKMYDGETRGVLKKYPVDFLDKNMYMCLALTNAFYALWSMDGRNMLVEENRYLSLTVPVVLIITMRYSMNIEKGCEIGGGDSDGDPVEIVLHDKVLLVLCVIYFAVIFAVLYL